MWAGCGSSTPGSHFAETSSYVKKKKKRKWRKKRNLIDLLRHIYAFNWNRATRLLQIPHSVLRFIQPLSCLPELHHHFSGSTLSGINTTPVCSHSKMVILRSPCAALHLWHVSESALRTGWFKQPYKHASFAAQACADIYLMRQIPCQNILYIDKRSLSK